MTHQEEITLGALCLIIVFYRMIFVKGLEEDPRLHGVTDWNAQRLKMLTVICEFEKYFLVLF